MDGLEKIIQKIEADAESTSCSIIADAELKAADIIADAESAGDMAARSIISDANDECEKMIRKAHSGGELAKRQKVLECKVKIIDEVIEKAVKNFLFEDPSVYFAGMLALAKKHALAGDQTMVFSDRDMSRLPKDFESRLRETIGNDKNISIRGGGSFEGGA
ncbi:MAG: V-type ATP synthase subunit E, partial [Clostridia bacterium]|nr:V-type ATP synthase subunit E [Clostridia bacterium]